jgi:hypothetical protein
VTTTSKLVAASRTRLTLSDPKRCAPAKRRPPLVRSYIRRDRLRRSAGARIEPFGQLNAAHTGATVEPGLDPPFARRWAVDLGQPASFPLIGDGRVFAVARNESDYGTQLYALAASDGRVLWRRAVAGSYYWTGIAYGQGKVYVVSFDGPIQALDAATGAVVWSRDHSYWFIRATPMPSTPPRVRTSGT